MPTALPEENTIIFTMSNFAFMSRKLRMERATVKAARMNCFPIEQAHLIDYHSFPECEQYPMLRSSAWKECPWLEVQTL